MRDDMLPPLTDCIPVQGASIKHVGNFEGQRGQISYMLNIKLFFKAPSNINDEIISLPATQK